jgi:hypothetical protein
MHLILEIISGPLSERRRMVREDQVLEVGRSALTDFSVECDPKMSSRHFRIVTTRNACRIEDLDSRNGTEVNGKMISRQLLADDDRIVAGDTRFVVHVEGATGTADASQDSPTGTVGEAVVPVLANYTSQVANSGICQYRGPVEAFPPELLMQQLAKAYQQLLIVNMPLIDPEGKLVLDEPEYLFDWLPEETRKSQSPWIISDPDLAARWNLVRRAWGKDALIGIFCEPGEPLPMPQVRRCAGSFVRPSLFRPQISETAPAVARDLLLGIEVVLVEDDPGESWLLFSTEDLQPLLDGAGLKLAEPKSTGNAVA